MEFSDIFYPVIILVVFAVFLGGLLIVITGIKNEKNATISDMNNIINKLRIDNNLLDSNLAALRNDYINLQNNYNYLNNELNNKRSEIDSLNAEKNNYLAEISDLKTRIISLENDKNNLINDKNLLMTNYNVLAIDFNTSKLKGNIAYNVIMNCYNTVKTIIDYNIVVSDENSLKLRAFCISAIDSNMSDLNYFK